MEYIQQMFAQRIGGEAFGKSLEVFKFEKIKRARRQMEMQYPDIPIIDLGVGEPDAMADMEVIRVLYEQAKQWKNRGYADNGILTFQKAAAEYMEKVYQVKNLNPDTEILHSIGSKAALAMIPQAFINTGDITLMTVPGYPIIGRKTTWLGGQVYPLLLLKENNFLPNLEHIPEDILKKAKLLYINYPNNPTGAVATIEFYKKVIEFANKNHIIIIQDAAYGALTFDQKPLSFLSVPGAKEVGIEVHSLSKAFNMTGWRLGFIAGNSEIVKAIATVKDNNDSGQFIAIQHAGAYALRHTEITEAVCEKYKRRQTELSNVLQKVGFKISAPKASFYEYVEIPKATENGVLFNNAEQFCDYLLRSAYISTVPWDEAGHYIRVSVTFAANGIEEEKKIISEIEKRLKDCKFVF